MMARLSRLRRRLPFLIDTGASRLLLLSDFDLSPLYIALSLFISLYLSLSLASPNMGRALALSQWRGAPGEARDTLFERVAC